MAALIIISQLPQLKWLQNVVPRAFPISIHCKWQQNLKCLVVSACVVHIADKSITMYFAYIENIPMYTFPQVPLGVLKNENTTADMIEIMEHVLKYAPAIVSLRRDR